MSEERGDKLAEILRAARHAPRSGWRERALEGMSSVRPERGTSRWGWVPTAVGVALVMAALGLLPYSASAPGAGMGNALAAQQAMAAEALGEVPGEGAGRQAKRENLSEGLRSYAERAPEFVREQYPDDPEMLMAAGLLTRDVNEGMALLREAVEKGGGGPAWAAYAGMLIAAGPEYARLGTWRVDPADPESVVRAEEEIAASGRQRRLSLVEVGAIFEAMRAWAAAEPENGTPLALETYYLYGLHRDQDALERWEEAGRLPEADSHYQESITATARLLERMGMSPWDALSNSYNSTWLIGGVSKLRQCARIGVYEGRLAALEGRAEEAVRWWMATVQFGRHVQQSADTLIECLVGIAIEGVGGSPVWVWEPDRETGIPDGPLQGGRLFHGVHHDFFVAQAGEEAAEQVRDSMVRAKLRSMLTRRYVGGLRGVPEGQSMMLRAISIWSGVLLVAFLVVFVAASVVARKEADRATALSRQSGAAIAVACLLPFVAVWVAQWLLDPRLLPESLGLGAMGVSLLAPVLVPLVVVRWTRTANARLRSAWRGNLRRVLPAAILVCAAASLSLGVAAKQVAASGAERWHVDTEMERVIREIGPEWLDPEIPPDAWRAEPPPMVRD